MKAQGQKIGRSRYNTKQTSKQHAWFSQRPLALGPKLQPPGQLMVDSTTNAKSGLPDNIFLTTIDAAANWARSNSLWPMPFATACCGIELMATASSRFDLARFGAEVMRFSPRQCDLMIVAGRVAMKMLPVLQRIWLQMPEPKWCISMGACACSGGVFDTYAVVQGVDRFIPVDLYIPGCPPRPEQLIAALIEMQSKIMKTGTINGREFGHRTEATGPTPFDRDEIRRIKEATLVEGLTIFEPPKIG